MPARPVGVTSGLRYGIEVRSAHATDVVEMARLLACCGIAAAAQDLAERLERVRTHGAAACLVATGYGGLSGLVALSWAPVLHETRPVARIATFVVDTEERRRGIGRMLLKAASQAARSAGCDVIELAIPPGQEEPTAFCRDTGFVPEGALFSRLLRKRP